MRRRASYRELADDGRRRRSAELVLDRPALRCRRRRSAGSRAMICCGRNPAGSRRKSSTPITRGRPRRVFSRRLERAGLRQPSGRGDQRRRFASWSSATPSRCGARAAFAREPGALSTWLRSTTRTAARCWPNMTRPASPCDCGTSRPRSASRPSSARSATLLRGEPGRLRRFHGAGCHPDRAIALSRALTEAAQTRLTYIAGIRDDLLPAEYEEPPNAEIVDALLDALARESDPGCVSDTSRALPRMIWSKICAGSWSACASAGHRARRRRRPDPPGFRDPGRQGRDPRSRRRHAGTRITLPGSAGATRLRRCR